MKSLPPLFTLLVAACVHSVVPVNPAPTVPISVTSLEADSIAHALIQNAFDADARLNTPDSVYTPESEIIANGAPRAEPPRLAGVRANGSIELGSSRFSVTGSFVWGSVQYRWVPQSPDQSMVEGWATIVIARLRDGEWRIMHVHSSTAPSVSSPASPGSSP